MYDTIAYLYYEIKRAFAMSIRRYTLLLPLCVTALWHLYSFSSQTITCTNSTGQQAFIALYNTQGIRASSIVSCKPQETCTIAMPGKKESLFITAAPSEDELGMSRVVQPQSDSLINATTTQKFATSFTIAPLGVRGFAVSGTNRSDAIIIHNVSNEFCYGALYYQLDTVAYRIGEIVSLPPHTASTIIRPEQKCKRTFVTTCVSYLDRNLYISTNQDLLLNVLLRPTLPFVNVGELKGDDFYLYTIGNTLQAVTKAEWFARASIDTIKNIFKPDITHVKTIYDALSYPGKNQTATIGRGTTLSAEEIDFRKRRQSYARKSYATAGIILPDHTEPPHIAFCFSGGGVRSMITTLGVLLAAEETGFIHRSSYISTLSGSVWAALGWEYSGTPVADYIKAIMPRFTKSPLTAVNATLATETILRKIAYDQPYSIVDYYGIALGVPLLAPFSPFNNPNRLFLGASLHAVEQGTIPFILCSAVTPKQYSDAKRGTNALDYYTWIECNPYYARAFLSDTPGMADVSIPLWALGRKCTQDKAPDSVPPLSVPYLLGICGSAFSVSGIDITHVGVRDLSAAVADQLLKSYGKNTALDILLQYRTSPATIYNFIEEGTMTLVDAGIACNLPLRPLLQKERTIRLIIAIDASSSVQNAPSLRTAYEYAHAHNIPFPTIDWSLVNQPYSVHRGKPHSNEPTIIYIPLISGTKEGSWRQEDKETATTRFDYPAALFNKLLHRGKELFYDAQTTIQSTIQELL